MPPYSIPSAIERCSNVRAGRRPGWIFIFVFLFIFDMIIYKLQHKRTKILNFRLMYVTDTVIPIKAHFARENDVGEAIWRQKCNTRTMKLAQKSI